MSTFLFLFGRTYDDIFAILKNKFTKNINSHKKEAHRWFSVVSLKEKNGTQLY